MWGAKLDIGIVEADRAEIVRVEKEREMVGVQVPW